MRLLPNCRGNATGGASRFRQPDPGGPQLERGEPADHLRIAPPPCRDDVHVHDLQATILHLLGLDHTKLTYRFQGRDYRLTDVFGKVVKDVMA